MEVEDNYFRLQLGIKQASLFFKHDNAIHQSEAAAARSNSAIHEWRERASVTYYGQSDVRNVTCDCLVDWNSAERSSRSEIKNDMCEYQYSIWMKICSIKKDYVLCQI